MPADKDTHLSLANACCDGDVDSVRRLLQRHDFNLTAPINERSFIHYAATGSKRIKTGDPTIILKLLLQRGASAHLLNEDKETALFCALRAKNFPALRLLLRDIPWHIKDEDGNTLLDKAREELQDAKAEQDTAAIQVFQRIVSYLENTYHLHDACSHGNLNEVRRLVEQEGVFPEFYTPTGLTPLHTACNYAHPKIVEYLLQCRVTVFDETWKVDVNKANFTEQHSAKPTGMTPIYIISANKDNSKPKERAQIAAMLIQHGAKVENATGEMNERTPLLIACMSGYLDVARVLVEQGHADPRPLAGKQLTLFQKHPHIVTYLQHAAKTFTPKLMVQPALPQYPVHPDPFSPRPQPQPPKPQNHGDNAVHRPLGATAGRRPAQPPAQGQRPHYHQPAPPPRAAVSHHHYHAPMPQAQHSHPGYDTVHAPLGTSAASQHRQPSSPYHAPPPPSQGGHQTQAAQGRNPNGFHAQPAPRNHQQALPGSQQRPLPGPQQRQGNQQRDLQQQFAGMSVTRR